jgi:hypothetical protein
MTKRRLVLWLIAALAVAVLLTPVWLGYLGPRTAAWATTWRPWRTHLQIEDVETSPVSPHDLGIAIEYRDPWPGQARTPGWQYDFLTLHRPASWLPWLVTERGAGP